MQNTKREILKVVLHQALTQDQKAVRAEAKAANPVHRTDAATTDKTGREILKVVLNPPATLTPVQEPRIPKTGREILRDVTNLLLLQGMVAPLQQVNTNTEAKQPKTEKEILRDVLNRINKK